MLDNYNDLSASYSFGYLCSNSFFKILISPFFGYLFYLFFITSILFLKLPLSWGFLVLVCFFLANVIFFKTNYVFIYLFLGVFGYLFLKEIPAKIFSKESLIEVISVGKFYKLGNGELVGRLETGQSFIIKDSIWGLEEGVFRIKALLKPLSETKSTLPYLIKDINYELVKLLSFKKSKTLEINPLREFWRDSIGVVNNYLELLLLANRGTSKKVERLFKEIGLYHLLVISGVHINIIAKLLSYPFKLVNIFLGRERRWFNFREVIINLTTLIVVFYYIYLLKFPIPALRAWTMLFFNSLVILFSFSKTKGAGFFSFNLTLTVFLLFRPLLIFNLSFQLSFASTYLVLLSNYCFKERAGYWKTLARVPLICFGILVNITLTRKFNLAWFWGELIFAPLFKIFIILAWITLPLPQLLSPLIKLLEILLSFAVSLTPTWHLPDWMTNLSQTLIPLLILYLIIYIFVFQEKW